MEVTFLIILPRLQGTGLTSFHSLYCRFVRFSCGPNPTGAGVRQITEGSGQQSRTEETDRKVICGASTTPMVKGQAK